MKTVAHPAQSRLLGLLRFMLDSDCHRDDVKIFQITNNHRLVPQVFFRSRYTSANDAVCLDILLCQLVGVEFRRVRRKTKEAQPTLSGIHKLFHRIRSVQRMAIYQKEHRPFRILHQSLAEVDEHRGFEFPFKSGKVQGTFCGDSGYEIQRGACSGRAYDWSLPSRGPRGAGMVITAYSCLIAKVDGRPLGRSLSADGRIRFVLPPLYGHWVLLVRSPEVTLR